MTWVEDFVNTHPVLGQLPQRLKDQLIKRPSTSVKGFPGVNKRRRKLWYKKGVTLHLYSGENKGFTLGRALKETGGDERLLVEIDVKNGKEFDMMKEDLYEKLLRLALDDAVNCTVWRRFPIGLICFKWVETEGCHDSHFQDQELGLKWKKPRVRRRED